ncbi:MAG: hydroxymethylbilane synthase [Pseudonocardiales bacterium]|nr:hydroxymethylbilane synthase [Actinomycetota bacterium]PZS17663.1 MAG: hydroxymethylbilane synthase [Pseudonocardiales bacterium]
MTVAPLLLAAGDGALALVQTDWVAQRLRAAGIAVRVVPVHTASAGYSALRTAVAVGEADVAVHSYKDLPTAADPRVVVAAVPERADPRDALVARDGMVLGQLPAGAVLGTGSRRRCTQLRALGLGFQMVPIDGDVDARIRRVDDGEVDGVVVAAAGLARLGRIDRATELLDPLQMLPAPGQAALACECRVDDLDTEHLLGTVLDDAGVRAAVTAERALLASMAAACIAPVGALADVVEDLDDEGRVVLRLFLRGAAATVDDGILRSSATVPYSDGPYSTGPCSGGPYSDGEPTDAEKLGRQVAAELLDLGAGALGTDPALRGLGRGLMGNE